ncbi:hypothetical protein ACFQ2B_36075 [Streptomyces stramineus]|uniref:Uncharacterized protein n=1 Tax=Streptomyces stramineus TaxID=173861 RepID=A0ABP3J6G5_9ACTN
MATEIRHPGGTLVLCLSTPLLEGPFARTACLVRSGPVTLPSMGTPSTFHAVVASAPRDFPESV